VTLKSCNFKSLKAKANSSLGEAIALTITIFLNLQFQQAYLLSTWYHQ